MRTKAPGWLFPCGVAIVCLACSSSTSPTRRDSGPGRMDAAARADGGTAQGDTGLHDGGEATDDSALPADDAGGRAADGGTTVDDAGSTTATDAGAPAGPDAGAPASPDAGPPSACTGGCNDFRGCSIDRCDEARAMCVYELATCCTRDADCDDADSCTTDRCDAFTARCVHRAIPNCCRDASACRTGRCITPTCALTCRGYDEPGCCANAADCDDGNPCTRDSCMEAIPGFPIESSCRNEATGVDADADRAFAIDEARGCGNDCHDGDPRIPSTATSTYFTAPYTSPAGRTTFDYDCDGIERPEHQNITNSARCELRGPGSGPLCQVYDGWVGPTLPACGATAMWRVCRHSLTERPHCFESFEMRTQGCR